MPLLLLGQGQSALRGCTQGPHAVKEATLHVTAAAGPRLGLELLLPSPLPIWGAGAAM